MVNESVKSWLTERGFADRLTEHRETIDTVEHAAQRIGCSEAEIAKTLSFIVEDKPVIVVMAGDGRVNSSKFKAQFHTKPHMIPREQVEELTGFQPGGVCPFGVPAGIPIWLDVSMKRFEYVHPAGGNEFTSVKLSPDELEKATDSIGWCDVCKGWGRSDQMQYECKITVLETKVFPELQEKYLADPKSGPCPCFKAGDTFVLKRTPEQDDFYHLMNGKFCGEAWDAISRYVYSALQGGSIMRKWTNDDRMMIACCNDGTRPVIFKIERIDIPETPEEEEWLSKQDFHNGADQAYTG